jgi:CO/xanthine dehydrogenase Mo-binding subunit
MAARTCTPPTRCLGNSTITSTGPYFIPNVKTDVYGVYTNNLPGAAFRGFGAPQALFMAEMQMDKLAENWAWTRSSSA